MIQPLRTTHRISFVALAFALPLLLAAAVASRKPIPETRLAHTTPAAGQRIGEFRFLLDGKRASLSFDRLTGSATDRYEVHAESGEVSLPEILLYWSPSEPTDAILADAVLIGPIRVDRPLSVPQKYISSGSLLLFDAPHRRVLAHSPMGTR